MANETYSLTTIHDLLRVTADRRAVCMRELEYSLAVHELVFGDEALQTEIGMILWTDDGKCSVDVEDAAGAHVFSMRTTTTVANAEVSGGNRPLD